MTTEEIFTKLAEHMLEGMKIHCDFAQVYDFLGLYGFSKCHEYHYLAETKGYESLLHYYSCRYHKLLKLGEISNSNIIPESWYKYTTMAIDTGTIRNAIKTLMEKWIQWEKDTKTFYSQMYKELHEIGEIASAEEIKIYILDVDDELKHAEKKLIKLETFGYDISVIVEWQQPMYNKFKKELKHLYN